MVYACIKMHIPKNLKNFCLYKNNIFCLLMSLYINYNVIYIIIDCKVKLIYNVLPKFNHHKVQLLEFDNNLRSTLFYHRMDHTHPPQ